MKLSDGHLDEILTVNWILRSSKYHSRTKHGYDNSQTIPYLNLEWMELNFDDSRFYSMDV